MENFGHGTMSDKARIKTAAKYFGVSESFLRHALMNRVIPGYKIGGAVFVSLSEIESMITKGKM
jgi:excisionase family DNA binding protein